MEKTTSKQEVTLRKILQNNAQIKTKMQHSHLFQ